MVSRARAARNNEGVVVYACGSDNRVLGLVKVKTNEYVIKRRLREVMKGALIAPLSHGEVAGVPLIGKARGRSRIKSANPEHVGLAPLEEVIRHTEKKLQQRMKQLAHVPGC